MALVDDPHRILLIRPSALGDVCRSTPLLASLKRRYPSASIDWLVQDSFAPAIAAHPSLHRAVMFPRAGLRAGLMLTPAWWERAAQLLRSLRGPHYDWVIDAQGLFRSGVLARLTGCSRRTGYANAQELGWLWLTRRHGVARDRHTVDRMLALLEAEGVPPVHDLRLYAAARDQAWAASVLGDGRVLVLAPTSRWEGKRWPAERFAHVAQRVLGAGWAERVAVVASAGERAQCGPLLALAQRDSRVADLVGRTSVGELLAVIERAALVIANDSAAVHMAVGFDRPLVALYGPTRVDLVGPYGRAHDVLQPEPPAPGVSHKDASAGRAMMERISVDDVLRAAEARLVHATARHGSPA